jgi:hypothetical protein
MTRLAGLALVVLAALPAAPVQETTPQELDFVPVGVRYTPDESPTRRAIDLDAIRRARFNVIAAAPDTVQQMTALTRIDRPAAAGPPVSVAIRSSQIGIMPVEARTAPDNVKENAWTLFSGGMRGVIFDDWTGLQQNPAALAEASAFAETITRNMALYAPLRRVEMTGPRAIDITGGQESVQARWLESPDAMLLIAVNHGAETRHVTFTFPADIPEAVWQNMLSGGSVNFVAGPTGPFYEHDISAHDVLVLMIRKRWR